MADRLAGRRILITGGASGIGKATALLFAEEGARLVLLGLHLDRLMAVAKPLQSEAIEVDVRLPDAVSLAVDEAAKRLGGLDGVVTAAGIYLRRSIDDTAAADWLNVLAVNLSGTFYTCRAAMPHLRNSTAKCRTIVTIASGGALLPPGPNLTAYAASKGGVISMTKALAKEVAPAIRVNAVMPGNTDTPLTTPMLDALPPEARAKAIAAYAMNRVAEPREIANAILFLTSAESSYVTGAAFAVDGGRSFH